MPANELEGADGLRSRSQKSAEPLGAFLVDRSSPSRPDMEFSDSARLQRVARLIFHMPEHNYSGAASRF
jgi:hypothetical protein